MLEFLHKLIHPADLPCEPLVEIAHRTGMEKTKGSRTMIARMQRLQIKQHVVQISKEKGAINFRGMKVRIYADETAEEQQRRSKFKDIRKKLYNAKVKTGYRQPSQLLITFNGSTTTFTSADEAESFYETVIQPALREDPLLRPGASGGGGRVSPVEADDREPPGTAAALP